MAQWIMQKLIAPRLGDERTRVFISHRYLPRDATPTSTRLSARSSPDIIPFRLYLLIIDDPISSSLSRACAQEFFNDPANKYEMTDFSFYAVVEESSSISSDNFHVTVIYKMALRVYSFSPLAWSSKKIQIQLNSTSTQVSLSLIPTKIQTIM